MQSDLVQHLKKYGGFSEHTLILYYKKRFGEAVQIVFWLGNNFSREIICVHIFSYTSKSFCVHDTYTDTSVHAIFQTLFLIVNFEDIMFAGICRKQKLDRSHSQRHWNCVIQLSEASFASGPVLEMYLYTKTRFEFKSQILLVKLHMKQ